MELKLRNETHFLGLILDIKPSWKSISINRLITASIALYARNEVLGEHEELEP